MAYCHCSKVQSRYNMIATETQAGMALWIISARVWLDVCQDINPPPSTPQYGTQLCNWAIWMQLGYLDATGLSGCNWAIWMAVLIQYSIQLGFLTSFCFCFYWPWKAPLREWSSNVYLYNDIANIMLGFSFLLLLVSTSTNKSQWQLTYLFF